MRAAGRLPEQIRATHFAEPAPGFGILLLAGIVGASVNQLDEDSRDELDVLLADLEQGVRTWMKPGMRGTRRGG